MPNYDAQRPRMTPPHVSLATLRAAVGLTIDELIGKIAEDLPPEIKPPTRGAISAIENGHRGASAQMLDLIAGAYGLPTGSITTEYVPRIRGDQAVAC